MQRGQATCRDRHKITRLIFAKEGGNVGAGQADAQPGPFGHLKGRQSQTAIAEIGAGGKGFAVGADEIAMRLFGGQIDRRGIAPFDPEGIMDKYFLNARGAIARFAEIPDRIAAEGTGERVGEVRLIDVARVDRLAQGSEGGGIATGGKLWLHRAERARPLAPVRKPCGDIGGGNPARGIEQAEPHQRPRCSAACGGEACQFRLKRQPCLVSNVARQRPAIRHPRSFGCGQHGVDLVGTVRHEQRARAFVKQRIGGTFPGAGIIKQHERRSLTHAAQP